MWFKAILGVLGIGGDYLKAKATLKQTKVEGEIAIVNQKAESIATWEQTHAEGSKSSWKDEFWTIVWSVPVIMCFAGFSDEAKEGFEALAGMPDWYTYVLMTIVLASFGIRFGGMAKAKLDEWRAKT